MRHLPTLGRRLLLLPLFVWLTAHAGPSEPNPTIISQAEVWLNQEISNQLSQFLPRDLPSKTREGVTFTVIPQPLAKPLTCQSPVQFCSLRLSTPLNGNLTFKGHCPDRDHPWTRPLKAKLVIAMEVVTALEHLCPGSALPPSVLDYMRTDICRLTSGFYTAHSALEGLVANRYITPGAVVTPAMVKAPPLIRAGMPVEIRLKRGHLTISSAGVAAGTARLGEVLKVRRKGQKRTLECRVLSDKLVEPVF